MKLFKLAILLSLFIYSCGESKTSELPENSNGIHKVIVKEVLHVSEYSYLKVEENNTEKWLAAPIGQVEIGETYYYENHMEMQDFESKELGRSFETIYFVEGIRTSEDPNSVISRTSRVDDIRQGVQETQDSSEKPVVEKKEVNISRDKNMISIAELYENRDQYQNKTVRIKAVVTKYNPAIMNMNWLHLQDGTDFNGEFDLTVTTNSQVQVGDVVVIEGKVSLNKDFGAGYIYKVIVENAALSNE